MEFIEQLKPFFKEGVKIEDVTKLLSDYSDGLIKGIDPLKDVTSENAWEFINKNQSLVSTFDKKVTEAIEKFKTNNFDKMYLERYNKEHPPEDEKDQKIREIEAKLNEQIKNTEEQQIKAEQERIKNIATANIVKLLGQDAVKIVDLINGKTEDEVNHKLTALVEFVTGIKNSTTETIMKNYSANPGSGGSTPETVREKLIEDYNSAETRGDIVTMLSIQQKLKKK